MIRVPGYLFILGVFFSYAGLLFENQGLAITLVVIGIVLSLYIWHVLAWNRDKHLENSLKKGVIKEEELFSFGLKRKAVVWAIFYSLVFSVMNLSGIVSAQLFVSNIDTVQNISPEELVGLLGPEYMIASSVFMISAILTLIMYFKLLSITFNDEFKMQSIESLRKKIPMILRSPLSIPMAVVFTIITSGLFSWYIRYKLMRIQVLYFQLDRSFEEAKAQYETLEQARKEKEKKRLEKIANMNEKYSEMLAKETDPHERKTIIAQLFKDLGDTNRDDAIRIISEMLKKDIIDEKEYKKLIRLLR